MDKKYVTKDEIETVKCFGVEQETIVSTTRNDDTMIIMSSDNTMITKLKKNLIDGGEWKCYEGGRDNQGNILCYYFEAPKCMLSFRKAKIKREFSNEQLENMRNRMSNMRKNKKGA